jgi:hypothetical protein
LHQEHGTSGKPAGSPRTAPADPADIDTGQAGTLEHRKNKRESREMLVPSSRVQPEPVAAPEESLAEAIGRLFSAGVRPWRSEHDG